jgi:hypothetical protein
MPDIIAIQCLALNFARPRHHAAQSVTINPGTRANSRVLSVNQAAPRYDRGLYRGWHRNYDGDRTVVIRRHRYWDD